MSRRMVCEVCYCEFAAEFRTRRDGARYWAFICPECEADPGLLGLL